MSRRGSRGGEGRGGKRRGGECDEGEQREGRFEKGTGEAEESGEVGGEEGGRVMRGGRH